LLRFQRRPQEFAKAILLGEGMVLRHRSPVETVAMLRYIRSKLANRARRLLPGPAARRFVLRQDGAAAVEFALVAAPFLGLIFAIVETALVFFAGQTLEAAATDSARLIMTGQPQNAGYSQDQFKTQVVCNFLKTGISLFNCESGVTVDVKSYSNFAAISSTTPPFDANGQIDNSKVSYTPGNAGDIVVVRLYYQWPVYVTMLGNDLSNLGNGKRLLVATSVFRNEPF
jgi:Flp pilus assembly protein TadG